MAADEFDLEGDGGLPDFLRDPMGIPKRHWRWMSLGLCLGTAVTVLMFVRWVPSYRAASSILVTSQQIPEDFIRTTVPEDPFSRLNAMVTQVLSRQKLISLIDEFDLFADLRQDLPLEEVVALMRDQVTIEAQGGSASGSKGQTSRVYLIAYVDEDPQIAAKVANRLAGIFLEAGIRSRIERSAEISRFLRQELARSDELLRDQNRQIAEFNERYRGELPNELGTNLAKLDRLQLQSQQLKTQIADLESRLNSPAGLGDPTSPEARLAQLRAQYDSEIAVHTPEHPTVKALVRQIDVLQQQVGGTTGGAGSGFTAGLARAQIRQTLDSLQRQLRAVQIQEVEIDGRVSHTPKRQEELTALQEKTNVSREKYLDFLRKVNAAELAQTLESAQQGAQVSIMDRAFPPRRPVRSRTKIMLFGIAGTLGLALGAGLVLELMDPVMVGEDQVAKITGQPILGSVSHIG